MLPTLQLPQGTFKLLAFKPYCLAIPLQFNGHQPQFFAAPPASSKALETEDFIGEVQQGGSCNVASLSLVPHCNGTHTECVAHILPNSSLSVHACLEDAFFLAGVVSVAPCRAKACEETYGSLLAPKDQLITRQSLQAACQQYSSHPLWQALVVRTLPNGPEKCRQVYDARHEPAFFSQEAIAYINALNIRHLLVDLPSIDKMHDGGLLSNHRYFWQQAPLKTITELIYVDPAICDGLYLLNLQIPAFCTDAAPSRPLLYPLELM